MYETWWISVLITWLVVGVIFGVVSGKLAERKGYSFWPYFALGFCLCLIGLVIVLAMQDKSPSSINGQLASSGCADELLKYKKLMDEGAISKEEFDAVKARLLSPSSPGHADKKSEGESLSNARTTTKGLLVASIAIGAVMTVLIALSGGLAALFSPPLAEDFTPNVPAVLQSSVLSLISGVVLYSSYGRKSEKLAITGFVLAAISVILSLLGVLYIISTCVEYEASIFEFFWSVPILLEHALCVGGVACLAIASCEILAHGHEWGMALRPAEEYAGAAKGLLKTSRGKLTVSIVAGVIVAAIVVIGWVLPQAELNSEAAETNEAVQELLSYLGKESSAETVRIELEESVPLMSRTGKVSFIENWPSDTIVKVEWEGSCYEDEIPDDYLRELNALFGSSAEVVEGNDSWDSKSYVWRGVEGAKGAVAYLDYLHDSMTVTWFYSETDLERWVESNAN